MVLLIPIPLNLLYRLCEITGPISQNSATSNVTTQYSSQHHEKCLFFRFFLTTEFSETHFLVPFTSKTPIGRRRRNFWYFLSLLP